MDGIDYKDPDDDGEVISYIENAIQCELVIEKTIVDIELIKKEERVVLILCDTNSMDTKLGVRPEAWKTFLNEYKVFHHSNIDN